MSRKRRSGPGTNRDASPPRGRNQGRRPEGPSGATEPEPRPQIGSVAGPQEPSTVAGPVGALVAWRDPRVILREAGLRADASLGQNFLVNPGVVEKTVALLEPLDGRLVLEVGPGLGHLTQALAARAEQVWALDTDPRMVELSRRRMAPFGERVQVLLADARRANLAEIVGQPEKPLLAVGNLPFYCSSEILLRLLDDLDPILVVVMVQREVARRIVASPGGKEYGSLSVACQVRAETSVAFDVAPGSFHPRPEVSASVVVFRPRPKLAPERLAGLEHMTKTLFGMRRKTLKTALKKAGWFHAFAGRQGLAELVESGLRPERLAPSDFLDMVDALRARDRRGHERERPGQGPRKPW